MKRQRDELVAEPKEKVEVEFSVLEPGEDHLLG